MPADTCRPTSPVLRARTSPEQVPFSRYHSHTCLEPLGHMLEAPLGVTFYRPSLTWRNEESGDERGIGGLGTQRVQIHHLYGIGAQIPYPLWTLG